MDKPIPEAVIAEAAKLLTAWLEADECECEAYGHSCGRPDVIRVRDDLLALTAAQKPDHIVDATKMVAQQQGQAVAWVSEADIAPFVGAPQMAAFWGTVTLASGHGDGRTVPLYLAAASIAQQPAADTLNAGRLKALHRGLELARKWATGTGVHGHTDTVVRSMAEELRVALSSQEGDYEQPAAVDALDREISVWAGRMSARGWEARWPEARAVHNALREARRALATQQQEPTNG